MANSFTATNPEYWSKRMQIVRRDVPVYPKLASFEERSNLKNGDTVNRPYHSLIRVRDYALSTDTTLTDVTTTNEQLSVDQYKIAGFYIDDIEELQSNYTLLNKFVDETGKELELFLDGDFLGEVANAANDVDDGDINSGTAGNAHSVTVATVKKLFSVAAKKLNREHVDMAGRYAVISPTVHQLLIEAMDGKDTAFGDSTGKNGHIGKYMGFDLHMSNNLPLSGTWTPANNPSEGDTVTISGVEFTFNAAPAAAGSVDIGGTTAVSLDNLVAAVNGAAGAGTAYIELAAADRKTLEGCLATDGATFVSIFHEGAGEAELSASEVADLWTVRTIHQMVGKKGAVDMVVQKAPGVKFTTPELKLGATVLPWTVYGIKTFDEGTKALVDIKVDSSTL
jgi:hypothetical protein